VADIILLPAAARFWPGLRAAFCFRTACIGTALRYSCRNDLDPLFVFFESEFLIN